jgi:CheY-like chemotaxis protein
MRESRSSGSVRGVLSNGHPYRDTVPFTCNVELRPQKSLDTRCNNHASSRSSIIRSERTLASWRVIYVDDESDIREVASMALELDPAFEVRTCPGGREAIAMARSWNPDLILLDVMMPGMDGPMTLEELRRDVTTQDIPVVFITARTQARDVERFLQLGGAGVISKPFDPMALAEDVRKYLPAR